MRKITGVVVGRFQIPSLTEGHRHLLDHVYQTTKKMVVCLGDSPTRLTNKHPLSFEIRKKMILDAYPFADVLRLTDSPSNKIWSKKLDNLLDNYDNVLLFVSRDSFLPYYFGKYPTEVVQEIPFVCGTEERSKLKSYNGEDNNESFRKGIIHSIENKFPTVYPTVDIAVLKNPENSTVPNQILLGRKPEGETWCFMGGFVDPSDLSLRGAAGRELREEVTGMDTHELTYVDSFKIDDWRYKGTSDSILTSLFVTHFLSGLPKAGDDLFEVQWFTFDDAKNVIGEHHQILLNTILNLITKK